MANTTVQYNTFFTYRLQIDDKLFENAEDENKNKESYFEKKLITLSASDEIDIVLCRTVDCRQRYKIYYTAFVQPKNIKQLLQWKSENVIMILLAYANNKCIRKTMIGFDGLHEWDKNYGPCDFLDTWNTNEVVKSSVIHVSLIKPEFI